jgi:hypothetical protein
MSEDSGNTYTLDVDLHENGEVDAIYFTRGGHATFGGCELSDDLHGDCEDDDGRIWWFKGEC